MSELDPQEPTTDEPTDETVETVETPEPSESVTPDPQETSDPSDAPAWSDEELAQAFGVEDERTPDEPPADEQVAEQVTEPTEPTEPTEQEPSSLGLDGPPEGYIDIGGNYYRAADVEAQLAWAQSLTPEQIQAIAQALDPSTQPTQPTQPQTQPTQPAFDPEDSIDPALARYVQSQLDAQAEQIAQLTEYRTRAQQQDTAALEAQYEAGYKAARAQVQEQFQLDDDDMRAIETVMEQTQIAGRLAPVIADPTEMFTRAYTDTLWTTPQFREALMERDRRVAAEREAAEAQARANDARAQRAENASRLTGGGGTPPKAPTPPDLSTPEARQDALVNGIAEAMRNR